jgi:hypothetical protein
MDTLRSEGVDIATVPIYYLKARLEYPLFNWLTQTYFMREIPLFRWFFTVVVKSGLFEGKNLKIVKNQMGVDALVPRTLNYYMTEKPSGNAPKLKLIDPSQPASGCFVSVCADKAIAIYADFLPPGDEDV